MAKPVKKIIITRHIAMLKYLINKGLVDPNTEHKPFANKDDVKGKHVYGILPNRIAAYADRYTEVQLRLPNDMRGKELTVEDIEFYALEPKTYIIREVDNE